LRETKENVVKKDGAAAHAGCQAEKPRNLGKTGEGGDRNTKTSIPVMRVLIGKAKRGSHSAPQPAQKGNGKEKGPKHKHVAPEEGTHNDQGWDGDKGSVTVQKRLIRATRFAAVNPRGRGLWASDLNKGLKPGRTIWSVQGRPTGAGKLGKKRKERCKIRVL